VTLDHLADGQSGRGCDSIQINPIVANRNQVISRCGLLAARPGWLIARVEQSLRDPVVRSVKRIVEDGEGEISGNDILNVRNPRRL
jgi:hypothetical protein